MIAALAQAVLQQVAQQTPDTARSMTAGYAAIGILLVGYTVCLWMRHRKLK
jgi:hypothetical protein